MARLLTLAGVTLLGRACLGDVSLGRDTRTPRGMSAGSASMNGTVAALGGHCAGSHMLTESGRVGSSARHPMSSVVTARTSVDARGNLKDTPANRALHPVTTPQEVFTSKALLREAHYADERSLVFHGDVAKTLRDPHQRGAPGRLHRDFAAVLRTA